MTISLQGASARARALVRPLAASRAPGPTLAHPAWQPGAPFRGRGGLCRAGYQLRALLVHAVFRKVLFLAPTARGEFSSGRVFNLVTSDAETRQARPRPRPPRRARPVRALLAGAAVTSLPRASQQCGRMAPAARLGERAEAISNALHARRAYVPAMRACDKCGGAV